MRYKMEAKAEGRGGDGVIDSILSRGEWQTFEIGLNHENNIPMRKQNGKRTKQVVGRRTDCVDGLQSFNFVGALAVLVHRHRLRTLP